MTEVFEHNPGDHEDPLPGPMWMIGFLGAVLMLVIVFGLTALLYNALHEEEQIKLVDRDPVELSEIRTKQLAQLTIATPRWVQDPKVDDEAPLPPRRFAIPLEQAMEIVVAEAQGGASPGGTRQGGTR